MSIGLIFCAVALTATWIARTRHLGAAARRSRAGAGGDAVIINDAHCHFFSPQFFATLGRQRATPEADSRNPAPPPSASDICRELNWDDPVSAEALADRWVAELDARGVRRAALIASLRRRRGVGR